MVNKQTMKILAIIPAKLDSTRLKNKNIRELNGKPMFIHSVEYAGPEATEPLSEQDIKEKTPLLPLPEVPESEEKTDRFPELVELEDKIRRRLRSNQRFLERFMDEDFDDLDDEDADVIIDDDEPDLTEEL